MKLCFLIFFFLVMMGCSHSDRSGDTDSFDPKGSLLSSSSSSLITSSISSSSSSSFDPILEPIEWPETSDDGTFSLPHNPNSGMIKEFSWKDVFPAIAEPKDYAYGFDRSPEANNSPGKDEIIYISVKDGEKASFVPHLSMEVYSNYKLVNEADAKDEIFLVDNTLAEISKGGTYSLYGLDGSWKKIDKQVVVLAYEPKYKHFIYVQIDGDGWKSDESSFSKKNVDDYFNRVYGQAVVYANSVPEPASKYGMDKLIEMDMIAPSDDVVDKMEKKAEEIRKNSGDLYFSDGSVNLESPYWHIVFAINKERKIWKLENSVNEDYMLKLGTSFEPRNEKASTSYHMKSLDGCKGGVGSTPIDVEIRMTSSKEYYAYNKGKKVEFAACDILYTDDGYTVVPSWNGVLGGTAALSAGSGLGWYDNYLSFGSTIIVPRKSDKNHFYTVAHELGHSYGLTDVAQSLVYEIKENVPMGSSWILSFHNTYASSQTNVMTWMSPSGPKIRYRKTPIVCTSGTNYYKQLSKSDPNYDENQPFKFYLGAIERPVEGGYENQWECIRDCFISEFSTDERKMFWLFTDRCEDNVTVVEGKGVDDKGPKRQLTSKEHFDELFEESMKNVYIK